MRDFDLGQVEMSGATGFDVLLQQEKPSIQNQIRVASLKDLHQFMRLSSDTLIHKSNRDLWALKKEGDGNYFIERLFDDTGEPLKG